MGKMSAFLKNPLNKRKGLIYSGAGLVILLLVLFFVFRPFSSGRKYDPISVIPDDAAVIFKVNNVGLLLGNDSTQRLPSQLLEFLALHKFLTNLKTLDSLFASFQGQGNLLIESKLYVSLHFSSRAPATALFILETEGGTGNLESALLNSENISISDKEFEGTDYYSFDDVSLYAYTRGNLIIASYNDLLLHSSISTCKNGNSFIESESFEKSFEAASESADISTFVHLPFLYRMIGGLFNGDAYGDLSFLQDFAGWGNIDITYTPSQLLFSGVFPNENGPKSFINIFNSVPVHSSPITNFLPANTSSAQAYAFDDFITFQNAWEAYMSGKEVGFDVSEEQFLFNEAAGSEDLADLLISHFGGTLGLFACPGTQSMEPDIFCAVEIYNARDLAEGMRNQMKNSSNKRNWDSLSYRDIPIFSLPVQYGAYSLFGPFFNSLQKTHIAICDSVIYIGNSVSSLKNMLNNVLSGRTLEASPHYQQLKSGLNSSWNTWSYLNVNNAIYQLKTRWLGDSSTISSVQNLSDKEHGMYMSVSSSKEAQGILFSGSIVFGQVAGDEIFGWFTSLDARIETGPVVLKAPALNKYWIVASDVYENVYLLDNQGRIEWKVSIEGRPNNDYSLVYSNDEKRCAVVFSAGDYIYMIGIDGKSKNPFPIKIDAGIATPLLVADYDKNHNYRIIFSDKDGKIRNFNTDGKNTPGWETPKGDLQFEKHIIYRRLNGKDYIITMQSDNSVIIANRKGETLVEIMDVWFNKGCNTFYADEEHNCFIASDLEGSVISIDPDGLGEIIIPGSYSEDYVFAKMGGDYIIFDEGVMYVMNINGEVITRKDISESSMLDVRTFFLQGKYFVGYKNHDDDMGLIGAGSNTFINDDSYDFSFFDLVEDGEKILLIKGYEKTISAEILNLGEKVL